MLLSARYPGLLHCSADGSCGDLRLSGSPVPCASCANCTRTAHPGRPCPHLWPSLSVRFPCLSPGAVQRQLETHPNRRTILTCQTPFLQAALLAAHEGMPCPYLALPAPAGPPACPPAPAAAPAPLHRLTWLRCAAAAAEPAGRPSAAPGGRRPSSPAGAYARLERA